MTDMTLIGTAEIQRAQQRLERVAVRTPLVSLLPSVRERPVLLKAESLQPTGSFKLRGAYNAAAALAPDRRAHSVVAHSSGNHGIGVAYAARLLGILATVVMPTNAPAVKRQAVEAEGAEVVLVEPASEARAQCAAELARERGARLIPSAADPDVIAGQATVALELLDQLGEIGGWCGAPATILVPVGGGGLAAGVATTIKLYAPAVRVFGVEPKLAADAAASLAAGRVVSWPAEQVGRTIADGMRLSAVSELTLAHMLRYLDGIVLVEEDEIRAAMKIAATRGRLVAEPSGAASLAAALFHEDELLAHGPLVAVISGGNADPVLFRELFAGDREVETGGKPADAPIRAGR